MKIVFTALYPNHCHYRQNVFLKHEFIWILCSQYEHVSWIVQLQNHGHWRQNIYLKPEIIWILFNQCSRLSYFRYFLIYECQRTSWEIVLSSSWHIPTTDNLHIYVILCFLIPTTPYHNDHIDEFLNSCKKEPIAFNTANNRKGLFYSFFLNVNQHRQAFL